MKDQPELNEFEEQLVEGFNQALDWAQVTHPEHSFRIQREWDAPYARYTFLFITVFPDKEKYIGMFAHTNSIYTADSYFQYIKRALINEFSVE